MKTTLHPPRECRQGLLQKGFSLVELMVGLTIGLVLIAGLALIFGKSSQSGNELEKSIRQIENGRYAMDLLHEEISLAGYYGEIPPYNLAYSSPAACETSATGFDNSPASPAVPMPITGIAAADVSAACLSNRLANTPAFTVHRLGAEGAPATPASAAPGTIYVQSSRCETDGLAFVAAAASSAFALKELNCSTTNAQVRPFVSRTYFLASCSECTGAGDGIPTLKMAELRGTSMVVAPLVEGIENMVLEYGFDTDLDGHPDVFQTALSTTPGADKWDNVVAVKVHLLARTIERSRDYNDSDKTYQLGPASVPGDTSGFKRRVYTSTIRIQNEAGHRETVPYVPASS